MHAPPPGLELDSILAAMEYWADTTPDAPFLHIDRREPVTFGALRALAHVTARRLRRCGVTSGARVLVMSRTRVEAYGVWLGANLLGASEMSVNVGFRTEQLRHALDLAEPVVVVAEQEFLHVVLDAITKSKTTPRVLLFDGARVSTDSPASLLSDVDPAEEVEFVEPAPSDECCVILTSGTTGPAKGVVIPHAHALSWTTQIILGVRIDASDVMYDGYANNFHVGGKFVFFGAPLRCGIPVFMTSTFDAAQWVERVRETGATVTTLHGPLLEAVYKEPPGPRDAEHRLSRLIAIPLPAAFGEDFERRFNVEAIECWGMTELGTITWKPLGEPSLPGNAGKLISERFELAIVDPDTDEILAPGTIGEITVRHRDPWTITAGYLGMPERTLHAFRNLRFHSGDLGYLDTDASLHFVSRLDDRIRRRAENISPNEIETVALGCPGVLEVAAIGIPTSAWDDEIKLCVLPRAGARIDPAALWTMLAEELPHYMVPRYIEIMQGFPRANNGKIQKKVLRDVGVGADDWDYREAGLSIRAARAGLLGTGGPR